MPQVDLTITMDETGTVQVTGTAIANKVLAYGLLGVARDVIDAHHAQQQRLVQPATALPGGRKMS
jgi:hypothetical protein